MWAIVLAVVTGVIGLLTKVGIDVRTEHLARKAVAAALAGELGAYLRLSQAERTAENIKALRKSLRRAGCSLAWPFLSSVWSSGIRPGSRQDRRPLARSRARDIRSI